MIPYIMVEPKQWSEMIQAMEENTRLKAEVDAQAKRLAESEDLISHYKQQRDEACNDCECPRLKAEVERLRKAGDAMADYIERTEANAYDIEADGGDRIADWNAAKEGKEQP